MAIACTELPATGSDRAMIERLLQAARSGNAYRIQGDATAMRAATDRLLAMPFVGKAEPSVSVVPGSLGGIGGEWLVPPAVGSDATLIFLHGGGYVRGNLALGRGNATELAAHTRARVFAVAYRQGPEYPFPAAFDDTIAVCRAIELEGRPYVLIGESAGGGLVLAAAMALRDHGLRLPAALVGISPFLDLTMSGESWEFNADKDMATRAMGEDMIRLYMGAQDRRDWRASPLFGEFHDLPPTLITLGGAEGLYSEAAEAARKADAAGVAVWLDVFEGMPHGFSKYTLDAARLAISRVADWVCERLRAG